MNSAEEQRRNLELFAEELADQLEILNAALLQLESDPASPGSRDSLMRAAHTVKGAARMVGLTPIERFAHALEELLLVGLAGDAVAAGSQQTAAQLPSPVVELLLTSFDRLAALGEGRPEELPQRLEQQRAVRDAFGVREVNASHLLSRPRKIAPRRVPKPPRARRVRRSRPCAVDRLASFCRAASLPTRLRDPDCGRHYDQNRR